MSSSDDEEVEANSTEISSDNSAKQTPDTVEEVKGNSITTSASFKKVDDEPKAAAQGQTTEALKELYGEDYEEPIGFEEAKTSEQQLKLADKLTAQLGSWFNKAKEKYAEELDNPDSKVNAVKRRLAILNEDLKNKKIS